MVVLTAIGRFFKKIWDWIKQTAWIQPLLIVGIIFGVIFSIPAIVKAVEAGKTEKNTYSAYFNQFKLSLEGEKDSDADKFTTALDKVLGNEENAEDDFKKAYPSLGEKFFVAYVEKSCTNCEAAKDGFSTLQKKLNAKGEETFVGKNDKQDFNLVTIFCDDENADTTSELPKNAFFKYLDRHLDFFARAGGVAYETDYYLNKKLDEGSLTALETADPENFLSPTIFLVELGQTAHDNNQFAGVTEIMFGVEGTSNNDKAKTLLSCWNHTGDFSADPND